MDICGGLLSCMSCCSSSEDEACGNSTEESKISTFAERLEMVTKVVHQADELRRNINSLSESDRNLAVYLYSSLRRDEEKLGTAA